MVSAKVRYTFGCFRTSDNIVLCIFHHGIDNLSDVEMILNGQFNFHVILVVHFINWYGIPLFPWLGDHFGKSGCMQT